MKLRKVFGWILLIIGVGIIFWTLYSSYNIFIAKTAPPNFFQTQTKSVKPTPPEEIQGQLKELISEQLKEFLPVNVLPQILNLLVWSILAGILIFGGAQISGLGIKLIRE